MSTRLRQLARSAAIETEAAREEPERCDLCSAEIAPEHRHLLDLDTRELACVCRPCSILFSRQAASDGHYRLVGDRRLRLDDFTLDDRLWEELRIPVEIAFFFRDTKAGRVMAYYPSPMGPTESLLELDAWNELEAANPVLSTLEDDVEALLVNRVRGARRQWLVPVEDPYRLVAVIRTHWRGLTGGKEVWEELEAFFDDLDRRAEAAGGEEHETEAAVGAASERS